MATVGRGFGVANRRPQQLWRGGGQYGTMPPKVHEHSVMRNIDTWDTSFIRRHYVAVLEALDYMSVNKGLGGYWSMV